jgi:hypothetical protein
LKQQKEVEVSIFGIISSLVGIVGGFLGIYSYVYVLYNSKYKLAIVDQVKVDRNKLNIMLINPTSIPMIIKDRIALHGYLPSASFQEKEYIAIIKEHIPVTIAPYSAIKLEAEVKSRCKQVENELVFLYCVKLHLTIAGRWRECIGYMKELAAYRTCSKKEYAKLYAELIERKEEDGEQFAKFLEEYERESIERR